MLSGSFRPPSFTHFLGTDTLGTSLGRSLLSATAWTLFEIVTAAAIALTLGLVIGLAGSLARGVWARLFFTFTSTFSFSTPLVAVSLLLYRFLGSEVLVFPLAAGLLMWGLPAFTFQTALSLELDSLHVRASRAQGLSGTTIILFFVLPNLTGACVASFVSMLPLLLAANISVAFLGAHGGDARLGSLIKSGYDFFPAAWWLWLFPTATAVILLLLLAALANRSWEKGS